MTTATTTTLRAWPTGDAMTRALVRLAEACEAIEELTRDLGQLVDVEVAPSVVEDAERPTLETLGSVATFTASVDLDVGLLRVYTKKLKAIRDALALEDSLVPSAAEAAKHAR